jgi:hypothetical protein
MYATPARSIHYLDKLYRRIKDLIEDRSWDCLFWSTCTRGLFIWRREKVCCKNEFRTAIIHKQPIDAFKNDFKGEFL